MALLGSLCVAGRIIAWNFKTSGGECRARLLISAMSCDSPKSAWRGILLYIGSFLRKSRGPVMDKFWSIFTMPIGVALCFGPAMLVWWLTKGKKTDKDEHD
jgi:hypothetical protein